MSRILRVLLVDDEEYVVDALKLLLERAMLCQVFTANSGKAALRLAQSQKPDVILLDVMMPGMSGGEVAEALQESTATSNIPVIFLTGLLGKSELPGHRSTIGGKIYVSKPAPLDAIIQAITESCK